MKNILIIVACLFLLVSCTHSPQEYFNVATLNCNKLYGFASSYELKRDLGTVSEKLVDATTMKMAALTRAEVVTEKLKTARENYEKVKRLTSNEATDEMIKASTALYEFVIPIYQNEYTQLAILYDENAPAEKIQEAEKDITEKYAGRFESLYQHVIKTGTGYAARNGIEVRQVDPSPR